MAELVLYLGTECASWTGSAMVAPQGKTLLLALVLVHSACVTGYEDGLGYRARQAVLRRDVEAFPALMEEAADTVPAFPQDNPERTVLTHFLDLADDPRFLPLIEAWRAKGWVSELQTCSIHRARYRGLAQKNPVEAAQAAELCLERARQAALDAERSWEIEACLDEAPFLIGSSTVALGPYLERAADPTEPRAFRAGLLRGMTTQFLQDDDWRKMSQPLVPDAVNYAQAELQLIHAAQRLTAVLAALRGSTDVTLLAGATAQGALELERASVAMDRSFFGAWLEGADADQEDLAWAWVRAMKPKKEVRRLAPLGIWNRKREPGGDAYWYACARAEPERGHLSLQATIFRTPSPLGDRAAQRAECDKKAADLPRLFGPLPLEASLRATMTASVAAELGVEHVILKRL